MSVTSFALQASSACSQEYVLPNLEPENVRRVRLCLAAWAASGRGTTRSWRVSPMLGLGGVHVVVKMPPDDVPSALAVGRVLEALTLHA